MKKVFGLGLAVALVLGLAAVATAAPTFTTTDSVDYFVTVCTDNTTSRI